MTAIRTLPLYLDPVPGEALDSWLAAIAHRSHTAWADMLTAAGLETAGTAVARGSWLLEIEGHRLEELAAAVGIDTAMIKSMTRSRYDGTALDIGRDPIRRTRRFPWGYVGRSRYCPHCLAQTGGRWQLAWRLGWSFVCVEHQCLLVDSCPRCGRPPRGGDPWRVMLCRSQDGAVSRARKRAAGHPHDVTPSCPLRQQFCFPPSTRPGGPARRQ
ncbi:MAG: TniQ family protein [Mycobacterium sp.]